MSEAQRIAREVCERVGREGGGRDSEEGGIGGDSEEGGIYSEEGGMDSEMGGIARREG